jgi:putative addiction module component (TIGR02574 family)
MNGLLQKAVELPIPERIKLVEDIWNSIAAETETVEITPEQRAELERRMEDFQRNPGAGIPWETVRAEALARR